MKSRWLKLLAVVMVFSAIAAACGSDSGSTNTASPTTAAPSGNSVLAGTSVTITGPERAEEEAGAIQKALDVFAKANNMTITYSGDVDWEANINVQVAGQPARHLDLPPARQARRFCPGR